MSNDNLAPHSAPAYPVFPSLLLTQSDRADKLKISGSRFSVEKDLLYWSIPALPLYLNDN